MSETPRDTERYRWIRQVGEGGAGRVWLVEDRYRSGSPVALKELAGAAETRLERLRHEFATLTQLSHPNLVAVHDLELDPERGDPHFTMEYVEGTDLVTAVRSGGPELLLPLAVEALRALAFLHDFGLVHRDIKPANLMVRDRPRLGARLVVLDFGLAVEEDRDGTGAAAGTLPYIAPEIFQGEPPGPKSDLYALGAVVHEAIHGEVPYVSRGGDLPEFIERVRQGRRARPPLPAGYPDGLREWVDSLLSPSPEQRPSRAGEALARLNAACGSNFSAETPAGRSARLASGSPAGRDGEIGHLWSHLTPSDEPRLIWLCGGPGSGKRRMIRWLEGEAVARGWDVVRPRFGSSPDEGGVERLLTRLRVRAGEGPTLALVDQVETAGTRLADFLERVAREGREAPVRVVAGVRPGEMRQDGLRRLLELAGTVPTLRRVDLEPLDETGVRAAIERATGTPGVSDARVRWTREVSGGEPVLVESLLVEEAWEKRGRAGGTAALDHPYASRLGSLSAEARDCLSALSVLGVESPLETVAPLATLDPPDALGGVEELAAAGLARRRGDRWFPSSGVLVEQVLRDMTDEDSVTLHRNAAGLLAGREGDDRPDPFLLARLWSGAGDRDRAVRHAVTASDRAREEGDPVEAAERNGFALRNLGRRDPHRQALWEKQAALLREANQPLGSARAYAAAVRYERDPGARADLLARQAEMLVQAGRFRRGREVAESALGLAQEAGLPLVAARAKEAIGIVLARTGSAEEATPYLKAAIEIFHEEGETEAEAHAHQALGVTRLNWGIAGGGGHLRQAIELFDRAGESRRSLLSRLGLGVLEKRVGNHDEAARLLEDTRSLAAEQNNLLMQGIATYTLAKNAYMQDRFAEAVALSQNAEDHAVHLGDHRLLCVSRATRARALIQCDRAVEVAELLRETLDGPMDQVDLVIADETRLALIEARLAIDGPDLVSIRADLGAVLETARQVRDSDTLLWALVLEMERRLAAGTDEPLAPVNEEFDSLTGLGDFWHQPFWLVRAALSRAADDLRRNRVRETLECASSAADLAREYGHGSLGARAMALVADARERLGERGAAAEALERGRRFLEEAAGRIGDADLKRAFVEREVHRPLRRSIGSAPGASDRRLMALYDMIRALNSEDDPEVLLESILDMAIEVVRAERGMILLRESDGESFDVRLARNLEKETIEDARSYSRNIVAEAGAGRAILTLDAGEDERFQDLTSVSLYGIRSLMCVPLRSRDEIVGTVYLDTREGGRLFDSEDLRFLEAFADHASLALENARSRRRLMEENRRLRAAAEERVRFHNIVGRCPAMQNVFELIEKVGKSELTVLIQGDTGTGKELVARAIHFNGPRREAPFVSENCAALPESLLQSELFGHVKGAFTGAERDRRGLFEQADGGTLFLDEIGDMSPAMQVQLLRILQEGEVRPVGGDRTVRVDVRFLAATHRDLQEEVAAGRFREDLMYRLQVLVIPLPPLRDRFGDVPLLAEHFLDQIARERGQARPRIGSRLMALLEECPWPGNVRQLENTLRRLAVLAGGDTLDEDVLDLDPALNKMLRPSLASEPRPVLSLRAITRDRIREALEAAGGNRTRAARLLGISRATIYRKIKEFDL